MVLWCQLQNLFVMKMPCATKVMVPLRVYAEIPILVMAGLLDQAVTNKVSNKTPLKLTHWLPELFAKEAFLRHFGGF